MCLKRTLHKIYQISYLMMMYLMFKLLKCPLQPFLVLKYKLILKMLKNKKSKRNLNLKDINLSAWRLVRLGVCFWAAIIVVARLYYLLDHPGPSLYLLYFLQEWFFAILCWCWVCVDLMRDQRYIFLILDLQ